MTPLQTITERLLSELPECVAWGCARISTRALLCEAGPSTSARAQLPVLAETVGELLDRPEALLSMLRGASDEAVEAGILQSMIHLPPHLIIILAPSAGRDIAVILMLEGSVNIGIAWATARAIVPKLDRLLQGLIENGDTAIGGEDRHDGTTR